MNDSACPEPYLFADRHDTGELKGVALVIPAPDGSRHFNEANAAVAGADSARMRALTPVLQGKRSAAL